jgi:hypothetical protein
LIANGRKGEKEKGKKRRNQEERGLLGILGI